MSIIINEIFYSIQGESLHLGRPCVFIRLTGCNLRCSYCDTQYAYDQGTFMEISAILQKVSEYKCNLVEITGGEPLLQDDTPKLIYQLMTSGYEVLIETNGSMDINTVSPECIKILDIKCPSSNESAKNNLNNLNSINKKDQIKFVIQSRTDYEFAKQLLLKIPDHIPKDHILFSPVTEKIQPRILAEWMLEDHLKARLQLQLHKVIWPDLDRGV